MSRHVVNNVTPPATFHIDETTGDVVAMSGGKEKGRLLRADLRNQRRLQTWRRKAWVTDEFLLTVMRAREPTKQTEHTEKG